LSLCCLVVSVYPSADVCDLHSFPTRRSSDLKTTPEQVLELKPDGVFLSNGPGDPEPLDYAAKTVRKLAGRVPIFGICLGHQIIGDRKSTRLNSSHQIISYAVFCLKKKKHTTN